MAPPSFHLHEGYDALPLHHEVDVPVAIPKAALNDPPALAPEPPLRDPLSQLSECLRGR